MRLLGLGAVKPANVQRAQESSRLTSGVQRFGQISSDSYSSDPARMESCQADFEKVFLTHNPTIKSELGEILDTYLKAVMFYGDFMMGEEWLETKKPVPFMTDEDYEINMESEQLVNEVERTMVLVERLLGVSERSRHGFRMTMYERIGRLPSELQPDIGTPHLEQAWSLKAQILRLGDVEDVLSPYVMPEAQKKQITQKYIQIIFGKLFQNAVGAESIRRANTLDQLANTKLRGVMEPVVKELMTYGYTEPLVFKSIRRYLGINPG